MDVDIHAQNIIIKGYFFFGREIQDYGILCDNISENISA